MGSGKVRQRRRGVGDSERGRTPLSKPGNSLSDGKDPIDAIIDGDDKSSSIFWNEAQSPFGKLTWFHLLLAVATVCIYSSVIFYSTGFIWDDVIFKDAPQLNPGSSPGWRTGSALSRTVAYLSEAVGGLRDIWFLPKWSQEIHYWPMTYTSLWIERVIVHPLLRHCFGIFDSASASGSAFSPNDSRGYHFTNVLLHVGNAFLIRTCAKRMGASESASVLSAVWFAIHPMNVESTAWIIERKDVLSGFFYLLAFRYHPNTSRAARVSPVDASGTNAIVSREVSVSLLFYVLALFSKTIAVSLPVALLVVPCILRGRATIRHVLSTVPLFVVGILISLNDLRLTKKYEPYYLGLSFVERVALCARSLAFYVGKWIWPGVQSPVYPRWQTEDGRILQGVLGRGNEIGGDGKWLLPLAAAVFGTLALFMVAWCKGGGSTVRSDLSSTNDSNKHKRCADNRSSSDKSGIAYRIPFGAWFYFASTLSPALGMFADFGYMEYSFVADRFQYLASIGLTMAASVGLASLCEQPDGNTKKADKKSKTRGSHRRQWRQRLVGSAILAYFCAMALKSYRQCQIYVNNESFYRHAATTNPRARNMVFNLGNSLMDQNRDEEAVEQFLKAAELAPNDVLLLTNFAVSLTKLRRPAEALEQAKRAVEADPNHAKAYVAMGNALSDLKRHADAEASFVRAIEFDGTDPIYWGNLGNERARQGKAVEAIEPYAKAIQLNEYYTKARINLSSVYSALGKREDAFAQLRAVLKYDAENVMVLDRLKAIG